MCIIINIEKKVRKLKTRAARLKARVGKLKARVEFHELQSIVTCFTFSRLLNLSFTRGNLEVPEPPHSPQLGF